MENENPIYMVSIIPENTRHQTYRFILIGLDNKLAAITFALANRGGNITGAYSVAAVELEPLASPYTSSNGPISMVSIP